MNAFTYIDEPDGIVREIYIPFPSVKSVHVYKNKKMKIIGSRIFYGNDDYIDLCNEYQLKIFNKWLENN